jgi:CRP-like cAMP-binding protein
LEREIIHRAILHRLSKTSALDESCVEALIRLPVTVREFRANRPILREGDRASQCCLLADGFCARSKTTRDGRQQILAIHIPGDIPDLQTVHLNVMDHDLFTLTECRLGFIAHDDLKGLYRDQPRLADIFWRDTLIEAAMFREWILNVGQRSAPNRLAHVVVELRERLKLVGRVDGASFEMPLRQEQISEALGITAVHVSRVIKQLRKDGVLDFHRGRVTVLDDQKLEELAQFDGRYLHRTPSE